MLFPQWQKKMGHSWLIRQSQPLHVLAAQLMCQATGILRWGFSSALITRKQKTIFPVEMELYYIGKAMDIWEWRPGKNLLLPVLTAHLLGSALDFWSTQEPESEIITCRFHLNCWGFWSRGNSTREILLPTLTTCLTNALTLHLGLKPTELLLTSSLIFPRSIPHFRWDIIKFRATDY